MNTEKKQWIAPQATEIEVNSGGTPFPNEGFTYGSQLKKLPLLTNLVHFHTSGLFLCLKLKTIQLFIEKIIFLYFNFKPTKNIKL